MNQPRFGGVFHGNDNMAYVKKADRADTVDVKITADGVFVAEDVRKDKGDTASVDADIAATLIENGHARKA